MDSKVVTKTGSTMQLLSTWAEMCGTSRHHRSVSLDLYADGNE